LKFAKAARLHDSLRLSENKSVVLQQIDTVEDALSLFRILYPTDTLLNKNRLSSAFASELGIYLEVLNDVLKEEEIWLTLASESSDSKSRDWSCERAIAQMVSVADGHSTIIDTAHMMDEIEARLFWRHITNSKPVMSLSAFLLALSKSKNVTGDIVKNHIQTMEPTKFISTLFQDLESLFVPTRWYEEPTHALMPRRYLPWRNLSQDGLDEFNGNLYQRVLGNGVTKMLHVIPEVDGARFVWRERSGKMIPKGQAPDVNWLPPLPVILEVVSYDNKLHVYDAIFPRYPSLTLQERLEKVSENIGDAPVVIHHPQEIQLWGAMAQSSDDTTTIRFPSLEPYEPLKRGGYILAKTSLYHFLKLDAIRQIEQGFEIKLSCMDGFDFIEVGDCIVDDASRINELNFAFQRYTGEGITDTWLEVKPEVIIVIEVLIPTIVKSPPTIADVLCVSVRDDLGINDITQLVDLLYGVE